MTGLNTNELCEKYLKEDEEEERDESSSVSQIITEKFDKTCTIVEEVWYNWCIIRPVSVDSLNGGFFTRAFPAVGWSK